MGLVLWALRLWDPKYTDVERTDGVSALSWWTTVFGDRDARDVYQCGCGHGAACGTTVDENKQGRLIRHIIGQ